MLMIAAPIPIEATTPRASTPGGELVHTLSPLPRNYPQSRFIGRRASTSCCELEEAFRGRRPTEVLATQAAARVDVSQRSGTVPNVSPEQVVRVRHHDGPRRPATLRGSDS
jgi:hypothetical protein